MQLTSEKVTDIIETVKRGVTDSWMGEFVIYGGTPEQPQKQINPLAFQLYLTTLAAFINKMEQIDSVIPPAPPSPFDISDISEN